MFCKKCGKEIADTVKFCAFCGAPVEGDQISVMPVKPIVSDEEDKTVAFQSSDDDATVVVPKHAKEEKNESELGDNVEKAMVPPPVPEATGFKTTEQQQTYSQPDHLQNGQSMQPEETKRSHNGIVLAILGVVAVALIVAVILLLRGLLGGKSTAVDDLFYLKDGDLSAVLNIAAKEPAEVEIDGIRNAENAGSWVAKISEDGKNLYYYSKIDDNGNYGTLCRIQTDKLSKKGNNDKYIEEIDSKVNVGSFEIINNTSVVYCRKDDQLSLYENGETYELADSVSDYWITDDKKYVVYTEEDDDDYTLFCVGISKDAKAKEIDSHVINVLDASNSNFILFSMDYNDENYCYDVYAAGVDADPVLAAENVVSVYSICAEEKSFYYTNPETQEVPLYSYVIDSYAESDANQKEPDARDYMDKVKASTAISESDANYYSGMEEFLEEEVYPYGYNESLGLYAYNNYDDYSTYYYDDEEKQWYGDFDQNAYYEAENEYDAVGDRIALREELKSETIDKDYQKLYFYKNGDTTTVCENVGTTYSGDKKAIIYTKTDLESGDAEYQIDDIYSSSDLRDRIEYGSDEGSDEDIAYYCCVNGGQETELTDFENISSVYVSKDGKTVIVTGNYENYEDDDYCEEVIAYKATGDGLGEGDSLAKEGSAVGFHDDIFYYYDDIDDDEGDLYSYQGGTSKLLAKNDSGSSVFIGDDGVVLGYTDWDYNDGSGDLSRYGKDGSDEEIARDVSSYRYLGSDTYLYLQDGDVYYQNKKGEETRLARNVDCFWYPGEMNGYYIFSN